jgi:hypothetical protein
MRHFITLSFLALAIACYALGAVVPGTALLLLGMLAEGIFWFRIISGRKKTPGT